MVRCQCGSCFGVTVPRTYSSRGGEPHCLHLQGLRREDGENKDIRIVFNKAINPKQDPDYFHAVAAL